MKKQNKLRTQQHDEDSELLLPTSRVSDFSNAVRQENMESGLGSGGSRSQDWGTPMDSFHGVVVYSNGSESGVHPKARQTAQGETRYGLKYQCVEYVNRYSALANGTGNMSGTGNAIDYAKPRGFGYTWIENQKNDNLPQAGDIIVFGGGAWGHVAIATNTSSSSVGIIQQNTNSVRSNIAIKEGKLQNWGSLQVLGWQTQNPNTASSKTPTVSTVVPKLQYSGPQTYTVRSGDTLWKIAEEKLGDGNRYRELASWNGLVNPSQIHVGQILQLTYESPQEEKNDNKSKEDAQNGYAQEKPPKKKTEIKNREYTVQKGDSLWRIAERELGNGSRYREIVSLNNIQNPSSLSIGMKLRMPA